MDRSKVAYLGNSNAPTETPFYEKSPQPYAGSSAGYCYCRFSRFKYEHKEYDSAIRFAELAKNADDESGEAYYLLGFYELFINNRSNRGTRLFRFNPLIILPIHAMAEPGG